MNVYLFTPCVYNETNVLFFFTVLKRQIGTVVLNDIENYREMLEIHDE